MKSRTTRLVELLENTLKSWADQTERAMEGTGKNERINQRTLSEQAEEAREAGDLEKAAALSRDESQMQAEIGRLRRELERVRQVIKELGRLQAVLSPAVDKLRPEIIRPTP